MKSFSLIVASSLAVSSANAGAVELTMANYQEKMEGMNSFVKFQAPW